MDITITKPGSSGDKSLDLKLKEKIFLDEVKKAKQLIDGIELPSDLKNGLSFLDMKNDTMMSYLVDLTNIVLRKSRGDKIEGHESVERTCEYRLILEKSKAIDQKLKYQLNRLLTARETNERMDLDDFDISSVTPKRRKIDVVEDDVDREYQDDGDDDNSDDDDDESEENDDDDDNEDEEEIDEDDE